jgi:hypothetical protein
MSSDVETLYDDVICIRPSNVSNAVYRVRVLRKWKACDKSKVETGETLEMVLIDKYVRPDLF